MGPVISLTKRAMIPYPMVVLSADDEGGEYETRVSQLYLSQEPLTAFKDRIEVQLSTTGDVFSRLFNIQALKDELSATGDSVIMTVPIMKATSDKPLLRYYRAKKRRWVPNYAICIGIDNPISVVANGVHISKVCDVCDRKGACSSEFEQTAKLRCIKNGAFAREVVVEEESE